jgi:hypothetical protein
MGFFFPWHMDSTNSQSNGYLNSLKEHELETKAHRTVYKRTISEMLRDKFGAKEPKTRTANMWSLVFDKKDIENHKDNYVTDSNPTRTNCTQIAGTLMTVIATTCLPNYRVHAESR